MVVAGLLLVAGCSGAAPVADGPATPTATPAPVPTLSPTPTATPEQLAPGVTAAGVVAPERLAAAHRSVLTTRGSFGTAYTIRSDYLERAPNGSVRTRVRSRHGLDTPRSLHRVEWTGDAAGLVGLERPPGPRGVAESYCQLGECLATVTARNATTYREGVILGPAFFTAVSKQRLAALLGAVRTTVAGTVERNGTTHYRIRATAVRRTGPLGIRPGIDRIRNVSFSALVAPSGLIRHYRLAYTADRGGAPVRVRLTTRFSALGATTVERPGWYGTARDAT